MLQVGYCVFIASSISTCCRYTDGDRYRMDYHRGRSRIFMQAGFALVEAGFTRAKNTVNIMGKNLLDFVMSVTSLDTLSCLGPETYFGETTVF